jgi:uncharacterized protein
MERRIFDGRIETRAVDGKETRVLVGTAAVFNRNSEKLGWFIERIEPGAFDGVLDNDVRALFNHDPNYILGRNKAGTLRLGLNADGLQYEIDLPDTQVARDLATSIERGDVSQSSFAFQVGEDRWENDGNDEVRVIIRVNRLYDVSPVTYPAYPDTSIAKRSHDEWMEQQEKPEPEKEAEQEDPTWVIRHEIKKEIMKAAL